MINKIRETEEAKRKGKRSEISRRNKRIRKKNVMRK